MKTYQMKFELCAGSIGIQIEPDDLERIAVDRFMRAKYEDVLIAQLRNDINFDECINRVVVQIVDDLIARVEEEM